MKPGRIDIVENRFIGIKSRGYETKRGVYSLDVTKRLVAPFSELRMLIWKG